MQTGDLGERAVFEYLQQHYEKKYPACEVREGDGEFSVIGEHEGRPLDLTVSWLNVGCESYASYDLEIVKNGDSRVIEVKSSEKPGQFVMHLSGKELGVMKRRGSRYRLFCVPIAPSDEANFIKIKNPYEALGLEDVDRPEPGSTIRLSLL